tara:strand:+ start:8534 stop:8638 length:105 start_codon:yes stop_codon:yes gene_type:complete
MLGNLLNACIAVSMGHGKLAALDKEKLCGSLITR